MLRGCLAPDMAACSDFFFAASGTLVFCQHWTYGERGVRISRHRYGRADFFFANPGPWFRGAGDLFWRHSLLGRFTLRSRHKQKRGSITLRKWPQGLQWGHVSASMPAPTTSDTSAAVRRCKTWACLTRLTLYLKKKIPPLISLRKVSDVSDVPTFYSV